MGIVGNMVAKRAIFFYIKNKLANNQLKCYEYYWISKNL